MRLGYWVICCLGAAAAAFAGCSYNRDHATLSLIGPQKGFFLSEEGGAAKLAYGVADSDDVGLMLECAKGSGTVQVSDQVGSNSAPQLILASSGGRSELKAEVEPGEFASFVTASAPMATPALVGFRTSGKIEIGYAGQTYGLTARPAERAVVDRFFAACEGRQA